MFLTDSELTMNYKCNKIDLSDLVSYKRQSRTANIKALDTKCFTTTGVFTYFA